MIELRSFGPVYEIVCRLREDVEPSPLDDLDYEIEASRTIFWDPRCPPETRERLERFTRAAVDLRVRLAAPEGLLEARDVQDAYYELGAAAAFGLMGMFQEIHETYVRCDECYGSGWGQEPVRCFFCHGRGVRG